MPSKFFVISVCTVALLACLGAAPAAAQTIDKQVFFTFSGPVSLPGVTLPAGTYLFHVVNPGGGDPVVQVQSADRTRHYGFFLVNRAWTSQIPEKPEIRLIEAPKNLAEGIRAWWYPGEQTGYEFVYPKKQANMLFARERTQSGDLALIPALPAETVLD